MTAMRGVYGWCGAPKSPLEGRALLQTMVGQALGADHPVPFLAAWAGGGHADLYTNPSLTVACAGQVHWQAEGFGSLARAKGSAYAIAEGYRAHGSEFLQHLHGAFSVAVLDPDRESVVLAIDRAGIERLCYAVTPEGIVFAPAAEAVVRHPGVAPRLDRQSLYHYLYFHVVPAPGSVFEGVHKLLPGQVVVFRHGRVQTAFYWRLEYQEENLASIDELGREFRGLLDRCVERALEGVDAVGCFLSGGTDSSTLVGVLQGQRTAAVPTFSIGFEAPGFDESFYSELVAKHFQTDHHHYYVTAKDVVEAVPKVAAAYDEPFGNASAVPAYYCARLAREGGISTLLAGDGGDELFGGNERYATQKLFELYARVPKLLRQGILEPLLLQPAVVRRLPLLRKVPRYIEQALIPLPERLQTYNLLHMTPLDEVLHPDLLGAIDSEEPQRLLREVYGRAQAQTALNRMLHLDLKITLADNDLPKVSRMGELAGVHVRYPLLDDEMVAFSGGVPSRLKVKGQRLRYFFKYALRDLLPREVLTKTKHGFGLPFGLWMRDDARLHELARDSLNQLLGRGWVNPRYVDMLWQRHGAEHATYYGDMIWVLMMLEQWLESHGH
ncbi:MAG: asparagine synthetase B family protein [Gammaproteobacteria bacterium]